MKFIFATDLHIMGTQPANRKTNYLQSVLDKLDEVLLITKELNADFLLLGGDIFDTYNVSTSVVRRTMEHLKGHDFPIFSVLGNHDLHGHTMDTFYRSAVSILDIADFIKVIDVDQNRSLRSIHYYSGIENDLNVNNTPSEAMQAHLEGKEQVWVIHAMISQSSLPYNGRSVVIDDVRVSPHTKLVLCGDNHIGFPITVRKDGVIFANPGAICRRTAAIDDIQREIKVALVEYDPNSDIAPEVEYIPLQNVLPAEQVFDLKRIDETKALREEIFSYIEHLKTLEIDDSLELETELEKFAHETKLEQEVVNIIKERLQKIRAEQEVDATS